VLRNGKPPDFAFTFAPLFVMKKKEWFKLKKYSHIGLPLTGNDKNWVTKYVSNPDLVAKHAFYPFIHRAMNKRKFRKTYDLSTDEVLNDGKREKDIKKREIFYANHLDSNIFSYYSHQLNKLYEEELNKRKLEKVVTAYRYIQHPKKKRGMNNVDFAEEVFAFIRSSRKERLMAITFDIKSFFDNLNHKLIKDSWKRLLNYEELPDDHYNVFRNITKFSYVEIYDLFDEFKNELIARKNGNACEIAVQKLKFMRDQDIIAFCNTKDFDNRIRSKGLIKSNKKVKNEVGLLEFRNKGVPQGSPISSFLANLYLLDFDTAINHEIMSKGGMYRRYSDDIVIICNYEDGIYFRDMILAKIKDFDLEIQIKKTNSFVFYNKSNRFYCEKIVSEESFSPKKRFSYLGFEFDGKYTYLKSGSLAKYYRSLKKSIMRGAFYSVHSNYKQDKGKIFRRRIYKRFSYLGAKRKLLWKYNKEQKRWTKMYKHDWGNFITYANMANYNMKNNKIRSQISNHWRILNNVIREIERQNAGI
jgi:hypothetical protein